MSGKKSTTNWREKEPFGLKVRQAAGVKTADTKTGFIARAAEKCFFALRVDFFKRRYPWIWLRKREDLRKCPKLLRRRC
jgi:hypothetical protein